MSDDGGRTFLSRWSRRKIEARAAERASPTDGTAIPPVAPLPVDAAAAAESAAVPGGPAAPQAEPPAELPDPETLRGLESDYRGFLRPEVDESLRRTALKKLFADPHFNVMDGLDVYIDDYSKPDPIPSALLRTMNQARGLRLFDDEAEDAVPKSDDVVAGVDGAPQQSTPADVATAPAAEFDPAPAPSTDCPVPSEASASVDDPTPGASKKG